MFYVYIIISQSKLDRFYIGFSSRPEVAWQILPQPDSRHGFLRMSLVFVQIKKALNSSTT